MKPLNRVLNVGLLVCLLPLAVAFVSNNKLATNPKLISTKALPQDSIKWSAQDSTYTDNDKHIIKLYGKACITNSSTRVNADYIEFNSVEKTGTAKGNVVLYEIGENIIAKSSEAVFKMK